MKFYKRLGVDNAVVEVSFCVPWFGTKLNVRVEVELWRTIGA